MFPSILIENVQNYGFKAVNPQIVSYLVERGYRVNINSKFGFLAHLDEVEMSLCYTSRVRVRLKFLG
jgi:hypothetical protein